jgi:hypothetical protein
MNPALQAHTTTVDNDAILQRLDREHATAFETACRLAAEAVEADGGGITTLPDADAAERRSHSAWLKFESIGNAVACFTAETIEGIMHKARVLARQAQGMPLREIIEETLLRRLAVSILADTLAYGESS